MAVPRSADARAVIRKLVDGAKVDYSALLRKRYLPDGLGTVDPAEDGWVWNEPPAREVGGYGDPASYRLDDDPDSPLWHPPSEVLAETSRWTEEQRRHYRRHSVDLTMRGGTTSGVVYPLAVCEVATRFRVRNVGGASAGAIAAAATAAAELGRSSALPAEAYELSDAQRRAGHVRPGFVGLADTVSWVAQICPGDDDKDSDQFRLAQLFRPARGERRVFAIATALMRQRSWAVPLVALMAFGWLSKLILLVLGVGGIALTAWLGTQLASWPPVARPGEGWVDVAWAVLDLALFFAAVGAVLILVTRRRERTAPMPDWLRKLSSVSSADRKKSPSPVQPVLAVVVLVAVVVLAWVGWWHWAAALIAGTGLSALLAVVVVWSVLHYLGNLRARRFGLLATATPRSRRTFGEVLAGAATPTVDPGLLPWLTDLFNRLAGLEEGEVLRFGHLWQGRDFRPESTEDLERLADNPRDRLVNLELVTTDLTRQRPYRFPLSRQDEQLYFDVADIEDLFGADVVEALKGGQEPLDSVDGSPRLYRLPEPWNLPVAFAVQLSLAMPGMFKAVRLYRITSGTTIRDDLGRAIVDKDTGEELRTPKKAEELWFSDGGITSNFPVHLFDVALPGWPTFGLNLGEHPHSFPHQDVWLPQDWQVGSPPATAVRPGALSFLGAVVDTARSWRDTMQTGMPGSRGRVVWVRQRPDEGGTNLFMSRECIASMALRGALAGARLSRRFSDEKQWDRYRWLRLRIALNNLRDLNRETSLLRPAYHDILTGGEEFLSTTAAGYHYDPFAEGIDWYEPDDDAFWPTAADLVNDQPPNIDAVKGGPDPAPDLKQTPPM
jgi:predicted acylesterase/phospholipase RssA